MQDTLPVKFDSLKPAVVTAALRPRLKGDTLEYNTEHLNMLRNTAVEELFRRLPGLQVAPDGTITYNGEKIERLLVNGEDIFGSNPTIVTRSFDADKIAKIQILDRKSDQAIFSGIDDGRRTKTINLVIKESAKDGFFGRIEAGGNTDGYYSIGGVLAGFRKKEQVTALVQSGNTGSALMGSKGAATSSGVGVTLTPDVLNASAGAGIPRFNTAALHYANKWDEPENHINVNYQYGELWTHPVSSTRILQIQSDGVYGQYQTSQSINQQREHKVDASFEWPTGRQSTLLLQGVGNIAQFQNQYNATTSSSFNDAAVNRSTRSIRDNGENHSIYTGFIWRLGTQKPGCRSLTIGSGFQKNSRMTNGNIQSYSQFWQPMGTILSNDTVDQRKRIVDNNLIIKNFVGYTQPLGVNTKVSVTYVFEINNNNPVQETYTLDGQKYDLAVDSLTADTKARTVGHFVDLVLQRQGAKFTYLFGMDIKKYDYHQQDVKHEDSVFNLHSMSWMPWAMLTYAPNRATNFQFLYQDVAKDPSISQLVPVTNNSDPLHLVLGNPNLRPTVNHRIELNIKWIKTWVASLRASLNLTDNAISTNTSTDSLGRQISQPVNVSGNEVSALNFSLNRTLVGIDWGFHANNTFSRASNYLNSELNRTEVTTVSGGVSASKYLSDKFNVQVNTNLGYFNSRSSINTAVPLHYWTQSHSVTFSLFLVPHCEFGTNVNYSWQQETSAFSSSTSVILWGVYCSRNFLHDRLEGKFVLNNILDQNSGITRSNTGNISTQTTSNILGRYWMLSVVYHFDKKFKKRTI